MSIIPFVREGKIDGARYFLIGFPLILFKQLLDRTAAAQFHQRWELWSYLLPLGRLANLRNVTGEERQCLFTLTAIAIPFILVGVVLTLARLRALRYPAWFVVLFFAPVVNVLLFLLLAGTNEIKTGRMAEHPQSWFTRLIPESRLGSAILAVVIASACTVLYTTLSTRFAMMYGAGLFIALPFCLGLLASLLYGYQTPRRLGECLMVSLAAVCIPGLVLLTLAIEGLGCLLLVLPLAAPLAMVGGLVGWAIQSNPWREASASLLLIPILFTPGVIGMEGWLRPTVHLFRVRSSIEIAAPPESVWNEVVAFHQIPEPTEWLFRTGIAYPIRARIEGHGPGAVRRCEFSTGAFVEPIEVWDEPRLLRFGVSHNPPAMNEWSPYAHLTTPHLQGYFLSKEGQFRLIPLAGGHTLLEGTTWYTDSVWPAAYWRIWSDYVIHRIHMRVLEHIKLLAERS